MTPMAERRPVGAPWRYALRQAAWAGLDVIFPPRCAGCGKTGERFCAACQASVLPLPPPLCARCGYPQRTGAAGLCAACRRQPEPALMGMRSVAFFEGPLQEALHRLKYKRDVILADSLARIMQAAWPGYGWHAELVVPIPLSAARLRERGYNQAGLLARGFAELAGLRFAPAGAARARHTVSQVGLSAAERRENVTGAFVGQPRQVAGRAVIVVDDVITTGATLVACAEALRAAGASRVYGFSLGRARLPEDR